jgi:LPS sulfotransferase NodH
LDAHNEHAEAVRRHFGRLDRAVADLPEKLRFVFICFTNRCGSNFLADLLASTRRFQRAEEMLNGEKVLANATLHGHRSLQEYFAWHVRTRVTGCNIVAAKLAIPHLEVLGDSGLLDQIAERSRFVFLKRDDRLAQAVSFEIARQTGRWSSWAPAGPNERRPRYSARRLREAMATIAKSNELFEAFFAGNLIEPVRLVYERLVAEPESHVRQIGRQVGLDLRVDTAQLEFKLQAGPLNAEWHSRFVAESAGGSLRFQMRRLAGFLRD